MQRNRERRHLLIPIRIVTIALLVVLTSEGYILANLLGEIKESEEVSLSVESLNKGESGFKRPARIRNEDREQIHEENKKAEQVGREVERLRDIAEDQGEDLSIEELKSMAEQKLMHASEEFSSQAGNVPQHSAGMPQSDMKRVCFRADGSVTDMREECDQDQGHHFGMQEPQYGAPPQFDNQMVQKMDTQFQYMPPPMQGLPLLDVIAEALHRISGTLQHAPDDVKAELREVIAWLSTLLAQYAADDPSPEEQMQIVEEIHERLSEIGPMFGGPPGGGGYSPPPIEHILKELEDIMEKLPQVIAIFEEAGIPIASEAREAYEAAKQTFEDVRTECEENPMECKKLEQVFEILESRMRPSMEKAMMASGNEEVIRKIEELMGHEEDYGPPMGPEGYGPPGNFGPNGPPMMMPPGQMMQPPGYGPPPYWEDKKPCPDAEQLENEWQETEERMRSEMEASGEPPEMIEDMIQQKKQMHFSCGEKHFDDFGPPMMNQPSYQPEYGQPMIDPPPNMYGPPPNQYGSPPDTYYPMPAEGSPLPTGNFDPMPQIMPEEPSTSQISPSSSETQDAANEVEDSTNDEAQEPTETHNSEQSSSN